MLLLCLQPFDNFIANETLAISDYRIEGLFLFRKIKKKMNMVRHYSVAQDLVTVIIQNSEEFVNLVIGICDLNEAKPVVAGKGDKVNA